MALSSAEAEYYSIALSIIEGRKLQQLLWECIATAEEELPHITVHSDSRGARESCVKVGSSRMKHFEIKQLFVRELVQKGLVTLVAIGTRENPVDVLTKPVSREVLQRHAESALCWQVSR